MSDNLSITEAHLNALLDAVRSLGGFRDIEERLLDAAESSRQGELESEEALIDLLEGIVRDAKPTILSTDWEEAWGNLFSHLVQIIFSSSSGKSRIIRLLYGGGDLSAEAAEECVLCVNPGSTSTKVALFRGLELSAAEEVHLPPDYPDSVENRVEAIISWVMKQGVTKGGLTGIACRGGFLKPVPTGTYKVCDEMIQDLEEPRIVHASNMAIPIGIELRQRFAGDGEVLLTTTDPVASDEMSAVARMTGMRKILRDGSGAHYLNQEAVHLLVSSILGRPETELTTIGAHLGGGISIMRHSGGEVTDLINAFSGVPSANRSGNIPLDCFLMAIEEGEISLPELGRYLYREGGLIDLTGTNDFKALLHFRDTGAVGVQREKIVLVIDFFAKSIAGAVMQIAAVEGAIDVVILTGGLSRSNEFTSRIRQKLYPYFPVVVIPGSIEHEALLAGHMRARFDTGALKDYVTERDSLKRRRNFERELIETEVFTHPHLRKKENAPITSLDEVVFVSRSLVAKRAAPRIAIVGAENEDAVAAAKQANEEGRYPIAKFMLVGDYYEINKIAWEFDITIDGDNYTIVDSDDPVERAVQLLVSGEADILMKGGVKTEKIMRGVFKYLKSTGRIEKGSVYSHVGVFQIPTYPKLLMVTDAAVNPEPGHEMKKKILENALRVARYLNLEKPKVAVISAVETLNPHVESSIEAGKLADEYREREDCIVEGPLSLDVAMDPHSAREKKYPGRIKGNADILLMPDIESGNVVYKTLTVSSGAYLAGVVVGSGVPIILGSRGDSARTKLASISLGCIISIKKGDFSPEG